MSQLTYENDLPVAEPGLLDENCKTLTRKTGSATILPGRGLKVESGVDFGVVLPDSDSDVIIGVAGREFQRENADSGDNPFADNENIALAYAGLVGVLVDQDVTTDSDVYVRFDGEVEIFTITFDADIVTGNKINGSINGVAITEVDFNSDNSTTLGDLATALEALDSVASASVTDTNEVTVTGATKGLDISTNATFTVTEGASQADDTIANVSGPSTGTEAGVFRADDDDVGNGALAVQVSNAKFVKNASAGQATWLRLNLP